MLDRIHTFPLFPLLTSNNAQHKIGIVIPTFGRSAYVRKCFESLKHSNLENCILCIVDESLAAPAYHQYDGYIAFKNVDSPSFDLYKCPQNLDIKAAASTNSECVGFNEAGWLKKSISRSPSWMMNSHFSLYIKNEYLAAHPEIMKTYTEKRFIADKCTPKLIHDFEIKGVEIIKLFKEKHGNMYDSIKQGMDLLSSRCNTLMVLDSDTIHQKNWVEAVHQVHINFSSSDVPTITSGFHTEEHPVVRNMDNFMIKASLGGCHMCMSVDTYQGVVRPLLTSVTWDHDLQHEMKKRKGVYACTNPSVIQHIGVHGLWSNANRFDQALDY